MTEKYNISSLRPLVSWLCFEHAGEVAKAGGALSKQLRNAAKTLNEPMPGVRPAVGYPMFPHASVSGLIFPNPGAQYFNIGPVGDDRPCDCAARRVYSPDEIRCFAR